LDMRGTSAMGMPWRVRSCLFSLGQGIASDVGGGSLQPPCSRSLVDGTPKIGVWSPLLCLKTGATEHINRGHARSEIEFQSNSSIADTSQLKVVLVTCCCYQMDLPARLWDDCGMFVGSLTGNGRCKGTDTASDVRGIPQTIPQTCNFVGCLGKDPQERKALWDVETALTGAQTQFFDSPVGGALKAPTPPQHNRVGLSCPCSPVHLGTDPPPSRAFFFFVPGRALSLPPSTPTSHLRASYPPQWRKK